MLVDEEGPVVHVERVLAVHEAHDVVDVTGVVYHPLEGGAQLGHLLVADAAVLGVVLALDPAVPAAPGDRTGDPVDRLVSRGDLLGGEGPAHEHESLQVEEVFVELAGDAAVGELDPGQGLAEVAKGWLVHGRDGTRIFQKNLFVFSPIIPYK